MVQQQGADKFITSKKKDLHPLGVKLNCGTKQLAPKQSGNESPISNVTRERLRMQTSRRLD